MPDHLPIIDSGQATQPLFWGVDVGGTNVKIGLVDDAGQTLAFEKISTEVSLGPQAAVNRVANEIAKMEQNLGLPRAQIPRVGLGTPGSMDLAAGMLVEPPNLPGWWHFPIRDSLAAALERPVSFINDANAAAFGEYWLGAGRAYDSMIMLTLGTGVGGGIIVNGELVNGVNSFGSECGHILVDPSPDARLCVWGGGRGQLEAYASASAVVSRTRERLTAGAESVLSGHLGGSDSELTARRVYEAARDDNDELSLEIID